MNGHVIVVDLGYGDAGKGTIVDWLCATARHEGRPVRAVVRFNGGAQAAHHVLAPSGRPHPFAQFGSGTFTPGTGTFLSRFMLVDPLALVAEAQRLRALGVPDPFGLVTIDRDALLTTPYHQAANRAREEARGTGRHGSCGMGIGETASYALAYPRDAPRAGDLTAPRTLLRKLALLRGRLTPTTPVLATPVLAGQDRARRPALPPPEDVAAVYRGVAGRVALAGDGYLAGLLRHGQVVFEGAQGVLLDEWRGFHPYTTWSTTTFENAQTLLAESGAAGSATRLGVTRTYQTRHGPGPFPTEDPTLPVTEPHNTAGRWQGPFRAGHLDAVALGYAARVAGGVDAVALTHLDTARRCQGKLGISRGYLIGGATVTEASITEASITEASITETTVTETTVTEIEPGPHRDLRYQESLTARLLTARPVYHPADGPGAGPSVADWPDAVAEIAGAPVTVCSYGPAVTDKTMRPLKPLSR